MVAQKIKAIETVYNGYRFRSRLEARWAVFFDSLGIPYQYEPEGYDLDGVWYLPDFLLCPGDEYGYSIYIEVKGKRPSSIEIEKARRLHDGTDIPVAILFGNIGIDDTKIIFFYKLDCTCPKCSETHTYYEETDKFFSKNMIMYDNRFCDHFDEIIWDRSSLLKDSWYTGTEPIIKEAFTSARSARFGKNGRG